MRNDLEGLETQGPERSRAPEGVVVRELELHRDARGDLAELYRQDWFPDISLVQWNASHCLSNSLRGVHLHLPHSDFLTVLSGQFVFGLRDLRPSSPTYGLSVSLELPNASILIPPGVAHASHCVAEGTLVYGLTHPWDIADDLACRCDDPEFGIDLAATDPILSPRDAAAGSFQAMLAQYQAR